MGKLNQSLILVLFVTIRLARLFHSALVLVLTFLLDKSIIDRQNTLKIIDQNNRLSLHFLRFIL